MKKYLLWCLPLMFIVATVGVVILSINTNNKSKNIYATSLNCVHQQLKWYEDTYYELNTTEITVEPANCTEKVIFATTDSNILQIDSTTGEIYAKTAGTCTLIAYVKSSATQNITTTIEIVVEKRNEDNPDKVYDDEQTVNCNLSQGFINIEYITNSTKDKINLTVEQGSDLITILSYEHDNMTILLNAVGIAKIIVDSPARRISITIIIS